MTSTFRGPEHFEPGTANPAAAWATYRDNFKIFSVATKLTAESPTTQVATFLYTIGPTGRKIYESLNISLPAGQLEPTLDQIYTAFNTYYEPYNNPDSYRYVFFHTKQKPHQPFDDFLTDIRTQARNCDFGALTDSLTRYQILAGVHKPELRKLLFSRQNLTLAQAISICQAEEISTSHTELLQGQPSSSHRIEVDSLHQSTEIQPPSTGLRPYYHQRPSFTRRGNGFPASAHRQSFPRSFQQDRYRSLQPSASTVCSNCGLRHTRQSRCPAQNSICHGCRRRGHWISLCRSTGTRSQSLSALNAQYFDDPAFHQDQSYDNNLIPSNSPRSMLCEQVPTDSRYFMGTTLDNDSDFALCTLMAFCDATTAPQLILDDDIWYEQIYVTNTPVSFKLDTGSQVNILPQDIFDMLPTQPAMEPPSRRVVAYTGHSVPILGTVNLPCASALASSHLTFYVTPHHTTPILGARATVALALLKRICQDTRQSSQLVMAELHYPKPRADSHAIIRQFPDVFDRVGKLPIKYDIHLKSDATPFVSVAHKLPHALRQPVYDELQQMLKDGIIVPVHGPSQWVHPMVVERKLSGGIRICLDPRKLNPAIKRQYYPSPTAQDIFSSLHGSNIFTVLDAKSAFWQVELTEKSSRLCTFATPFGTFRFLRLPYGICTATEVFQQVMHRIFPRQDFPHTYISTDDFLLTAADDIQHNQRLTAILEKARSAGLTFSTKKLQVALPRIRYLGHIISSERIEVDPERVRAILDLPPPEDKQALQRFLGMVNYITKFIPSYSEQAAPLRALLKKDTIFLWNTDMQLVYESLKKLIASVPILAVYNPRRQCTITVDASSNGIGAALLQDGNPIEYASTTFNQTQRNYAQIEKELLAIVFACEKFHYYIVGNHVSIETDHKPLTAIVQKPLHLLSPRLQRMVMRLLRYSFSLTYVPGTSLKIADTLSRAPLPHQALDTTEMEGPNAAVFAMTVLSDEKRLALQKAIKDDPAYQMLLTYIYKGWPYSQKRVAAEISSYWPYQEELHEAEGLIYRGNRLIIPPSMRVEVMRQLHSVHQGVTACLSKARLHVFWPQITADITNFIRNCSVCRTRDPANHQIPIHPHQIPDLPWETVGADIFQVASKKLIILVDYFSKFVEAQELRATTAAEVMKFLTPHFARYGAPQRLVSDNGPPFGSYHFKQFLRDWGVQHITSSPHYPRSNGMAERTIQTIKNLLIKAQEDGHGLHYVLLEYRTTPIGNLPTPAEMLMGRRLRTQNTTTKLSLKPQYPLQKIRDTLQVRQRAMVNAQQKKRHPQPSTFDIGDLVYYFHSHRDWRPAQVVSVATEPHSYVVETKRGQLFRRTRTHLRPRSELVSNQRQTYTGEQMSTNTGGPSSTLNSSYWNRPDGRITFAVRDQQRTPAIHRQSLAQEQNQMSQYSHSISPQALPNIGDTSTIALQGTQQMEVTRTDAPQSNRPPIPQLPQRSTCTETMQTRSGRTIKKPMRLNI